MKKVISSDDLGTNSTVAARRCINNIQSALTKLYNIAERWNVQMKNNPEDDQVLNNIIDSSRYMQKQMDTILEHYMDPIHAPSVSTQKRKQPGTSYRSSQPIDYDILSSLADCESRGVDDVAYSIAGDLLDMDIDWKLDSKEATIEATIDKLTDKTYMVDRNGYDFVIDYQFGHSDEFFDYIDDIVPNGDYDY